MSRALCLVLLLVLALAGPSRASGDFEFDESDNVQATNAGVVPSYPFTWALWFRPESATTSILVSAANNAATNQFWRLSWNGGGTLAFTAFPGPNTATTVNTETVGQWTHCVAIATSATDRRVVLNGKWSQSGTNVDSTTPTSVDNRAFGVQVTSAPQYGADGLFFGFAQWNVALSQADVEQLAGWNGTTQDPSRARWPTLVRVGSHSGLVTFDDPTAIVDMIAGVAFTNTGTVASDSPPIHRPQPQYSHAPTLRSLWRRSPLYRDEEETYHVAA